MSDLTDKVTRNYWRITQRVRDMLSAAYVDHAELADQMAEIEAIRIHAPLPSLRTACARFEAEVEARIGLSVAS